MSKNEEQCDEIDHIDSKMQISMSYSANENKFVEGGSSSNEFGDAVDSTETMSKLIAKSKRKRKKPENVQHVIKCGERLKEEFGVEHLESKIEKKGAIACDLCQITFKKMANLKMHHIAKVCFIS